MIPQTNNNINTYYGTPPVKNGNNDNEKNNLSEKTLLLNVPYETRKVDYKRITTQEHYISQFTNYLNYLLNHEDSNILIHNPRIFKLMASSIISYSFPDYSNGIYALAISFTIDDNINIVSKITLQQRKDSPGLECTINSMIQDRSLSSPDATFNISAETGIAKLLINIKEFFESHRKIFRSDSYQFTVEDVNPVMDNMDLSGLRLSNSNFKNYNISKSIFKNIDLSYSNLTNANMAGSTLSSIKIFATNFMGTNFDDITIISPLLWLPSKWTPKHLSLWFKKASDARGSALDKIQRKHPLLDIYSSNLEMSRNRPYAQYNFLDTINSISDKYLSLKATMMQEILSSFINQKTDIHEVKDNIAHHLNLQPYCADSKIKRYRRQLCI